MKFYSSLLVLVILTVLNAGALLSQIAEPDSGRTSLDTTMGIPDATPALLPADSLQPGETPLAVKHEHAGISPAVWHWSKDSIGLMEYHHLGEIAAAHPAVSLYSLGNYGQPAWFGIGGSSPLQSTVTVNGIVADDLTSALPDPNRFSTEDAASFTLYPQYQAFWYGTPGDAAVMDVEEKTWDAPRPITRLRHTEAANEYLYTDAMFTLNTSESDNIYLGLTRSSIGSSSGNNAARFENNRFESWNVRLRFRHAMSAAVVVTTRLLYDENLTLLNGGIRGNFTPFTAQPYYFEDESVGTFSATAFDPLAAQVANSTMKSERQHYLAEGGLRVQWSADSSQVTSLRISADADVRRFRDNLLTLNNTLTIENPSLNLTDDWSLLKAVLDHETNLSWAKLELQGLFGRYAAEMGGNALDDADVLAHARGKLSLILGPVSVSGFARLDQQFGNSTISFGAGGELPLGFLSLWGGASFAARPRSLVERLFSGSDVRVTGDRTPDLDKIAIAEAGVRIHADWIDLGMRGFVRNETRYTDIRAYSFTDSLLGRYRLEITELPGGVQRRFYGGSVDARLTFWRFHIDQQAAFMSTDGTAYDLLAPQVRYSAELFYRGVLIEGTLDLRVGGRFSYADRFTPLLYHPETGLFLRSAVIDPAPRSYTDMKRIDLFLFATIKQRATLHLALYNLLDDQYITTEFYPMFDRAFRLGVDWVFFD